jgi:hypothetical protein
MELDDEGRAGPRRGVGCPEEVAEGGGRGVGEVREDC